MIVAVVRCPELPMIRYRCPHCAALTVAHERRAGQSSVCKACVKPHPIPADKSLWLNELGELLHPPAPAAPPTPAADETVRVAAGPEPAPAPEPVEPLPPTTPDLHLSEPSAQAPEPEPKPKPPSERVSRPMPRAPRTSPATPPEPRDAPHSTPAATATLTPPPVQVTTPPPGRNNRPLPMPMPTPVPRGSATPAALEPVQLQTQADIAAALTAAIANRMKPRAAPRRDLRPSTAAWMLLTGVGIALVLVGLFTTFEVFVPTLVIGAIEIVIGYAWIIRLTHSRDPNRGVLCAIPPITFVYLSQYKYAKFRPLRFVATGAVLVGLAFATAAMVPYTLGLFRRDDPDVAAEFNPATGSKLEQLRYYRDRKAYDPLMNLLDVLAKTDPLLSSDAKDRAELVVELKVLCQHIDTSVKIRAMSAFARWGESEEARDVCIKAISSPSYEVRQRALELLPQWRDDKSARAVQSLIDRPGTVETNTAKAALERIGGPPAEQAAWALLNRADGQATKLIALSILAKVGGPTSAVDLRVYAQASSDDAVSTHAINAAKAIELRVRAVPP